MFPEGTVALITGASSGIGSATARMMARGGVRVAVNYCQNQSGAESTVEEIRKTGQEAFAIRGDVSSRTDVETIINSIRQRWGRIDILCNNAGSTLERYTVNQMPEDHWDRIMAINLKSSFLCAQGVWEEMVERRSGCIINVTSVSAHTGGGPENSAYSAAKGGLVTFTKALAKELAPYHIRVNAVSPGVIATEAHRHTPPVYVQKAIDTIPLGRAGTPEEVAEVILFLASTAARYITGEIIEVNGGQLMD